MDPNKFRINSKIKHPSLNDCGQCRMVRKVGRNTARGKGMCVYTSTVSSEHLLYQGCADHEFHLFAPSLLSSTQLLAELVFWSLCRDMDSSPCESPVSFKVSSLVSYAQCRCGQPNASHKSFLHLSAQVVISVMTFISLSMHSRCHY